MRPNLHVQDMCDLYELLLDLPDEKIADEIFNAGYQNMSIMEIAQIVKRVVEEEFPEKGAIAIVTTPTDDNRSYHINSDKIAACSASSPSTPSRTRCATCAARSGGQAAEQHGRHVLLQRAPAQGTEGRMSGAPRRSRHRRRRVHRQPHGRPPRRARVRVRVVDNLVGGREENLAHHAGQPGFVLEERDIRSYAPDDSLFRGARLRVPFRRHRRHRALDRAADGVHVGQRAGHGRTCSSARARPACESSSTPPRRPATGSRRRPTREDHPIAPQYPYALSKYQGEQAAFHWHQVYGLPVNSIRIFNAYGPRVAHDRRLRRGVRRVPAPEARRQAVHRGRRRHAAAATSSMSPTSRAPFWPRPKRPSCGEVWNLGAGNPQSVNRLVELLGGDVVHIPKRPGEPDCTWADISKINRELGWKPEVSFEEGVGRMMVEISSTGGTPRCGTRSRSRRRHETWFEYLGRRSSA